MFIALVVMLALAATASVVWAGKGIPEGEEWAPYADVHVTWDGNPAHLADWWVDLDLDGDTADDNYGCDACLDMDYDFDYRGTTLHFDETYVEAAPAYPQTHHVVLHDDGDGTYVGGITARYDAPWSPSCYTRMDVIEYTITPSNFDTWGSFFYIENEYCLIVN